MGLPFTIIRVWIKLIFSVIYCLTQWKLICMLQTDNLILRPCAVFWWSPNKTSELPPPELLVCNTHNEPSGTWHTSTHCLVFGSRLIKLTEFTSQNIKYRQQFLACLVACSLLKLCGLLFEWSGVITLFQNSIPQYFTSLQRKPLKILLNIRMIFQLFI